MIDEALRIAVEVHAGMVDRAGRPYILHPLRLMARAETDEQRVIALLHDTVEDGGVAVKTRMFEAGISMELRCAVDLLTRRFENGESYEHYLDRLTECREYGWQRDAIRVKEWDLEDNLDMSRLAGHDWDIRRIFRYQGALLRVREALRTG